MYFSCNFYIRRNFRNATFHRSRDFLYASQTYVVIGGPASRVDIIYGQHVHSQRCYQDNKRCKIETHSSSMASSMKFELIHPFGILPVCAL